MAASTDFINDKLLKLVECAACLHTPNDPKVLQCNHSFCKTCLDSMLKFRSDGSAHIECPLKCAGFTEIGVNQTTNDLKASVQFKYIMDIVEDGLMCDIPQSPKKYKCDGYTECEITISFYCPICSAMLCHQCRPHHNHIGYHIIEYIHIKYDQGSNSILPWCTHHATFANYVFEGGFICIYCKERESGKGNSHKIESLYSQIKTIVDNNDVNHSIRSKNLIHDAVLVTEAKIEIIRKMFKTTLANRKLKKLSEYLIKLNKDEEILTKKFDLITSNHIKAYSSIEPTDYIERKPHFQVVHKQEIIYKNVRRLISGKITIPALTLKLTEGCYDDPLGIIITETSTRHLRLSCEEVVSSVSSDIQEEGINDKTSSLVEELKVLLQQVQLKISENISFGKDKPSNTETELSIETDSSYVDSREVTEALAMFDRKTTDGDKFQCIQDLCQEGKEEVLLKMLIIRKNIFNVKGLYGHTILHLAVRYSCNHLLECLLNLFNVNAKSDCGYTSLHYAVGQNNEESIKILIKKNCDIHVKDQWGRTPLDCAREWDTTKEIVQLLEEVYCYKNQQH